MAKDKTQDQLEAEQLNQEQEVATNESAAVVTTPSVYVVGCKLPNGLRIGHGASQVALKGANDSALINGFGITDGVPAEVWEEFEKAHRASPMIRNGIVFAVSDRKSAEDAAFERTKQKTGLEQASAADAGVEEMKEE